MAEFGIPREVRDLEMRVGGDTIWRVDIGAGWAYCLCGTGCGAWGRI